MTAAGPTAGAHAAAGTSDAEQAATRWPRWLSPRRLLRQGWQRWLESRLPLTDTWALGQRNIYILPTRAGFVFALTLVVMLLAAINYQLNLGHALTFALAGAGAVSMHMTHATLRGLTLHLKPAASVFAGEPAALEVVVTNPGGQRHGLALRFEDPALAGAGALAWCDVPAGGQQSIHLALVPPRRGWHAVPTLVVETVFPFGLFRAWTVWRPAGRVLAWPQPEAHAPPLPASAGLPGDDSGRPRHTGGEFDGVRPWQRGDSMRQVVWKKVARSNELVSRDTAGAGRREVWLDWGETALAGTEPRLARLAAWVLAAERAQLPYGLRLPGREIAPAAGAGQRVAALDALAVA